jgi:hypothetical protein
LQRAFSDLQKIGRLLDIANVLVEPSKVGAQTLRDGNARGIVGSPFDANARRQGFDLAERLRTLRRYGVLDR